MAEGGEGQGERRGGTSSEAHRALLPVGAQHELSVAKLKDSAELLPEARHATPLGAAPLGLSPGGPQHAKKLNGFFRR